MYTNRVFRTECVLFIEVSSFQGVLIREVPLYIKLRRTLKHVDAGLCAVSHGIHEDDREELREDNPHPRTHQLVCDHLGKQRRSLLPDSRVLRVAKQV